MNIKREMLNKLLDIDTPEKLSMKLSSAYSFNRYRNGWIPCIKMLRKRGYLDSEIEEILRSKITRWAADNSRNRYGYNTASDLARYMDNHPNDVKEILS